MKKGFFVFFLFHNAVFASSLVQELDTRVVIHNVQGVIIQKGHYELPRYVYEMAKGALCYDCLTEIPDAKRARLLQEIERHICGQTITVRTVKHLERKKKKVFRYCNYPMCRIEFLPKNQRLLVQLIPLRLGDLQISGNHWAENDVYLEQIRLEKGEEVSEEQLLEDVHWLNKNPFHKVHATCTPQKEGGWVDVALAVDEERPFQLQLGTNNTHSALYNGAMSAICATMANLWNQQQALTYRNLYGLQEVPYAMHVLQGSMSLPHRNFGSIEWQNTQLTATGFSTECTLEYELFCPPRAGSLYTCSFALSRKSTNLNWVHSEPQALPQGVSLYQLQGYCAKEYRWRTQEWRGGMRMIGQIGGFGDFSAYRPGAVAQALILHPQLTIQWQGAAESNSLLEIQGQWTSGALIPYQQWALGGIRAVRGYRQQSHLVDQALVARYEYLRPLLTPTFLKKVICKGFVDVGMGWEKGSKIIAPQKIIGALGLGLQSQIYHYGTLQCDIAQPLSTETKTPKIYFSLQGQF